MSFSEYRRSEEFQAVKAEVEAEADLQFFLDNTESSEASAIADEEYGYDYSPEDTTSSTNNDSNNKEETNTRTNRPYRNPLRKIGGGRVLQYPIDLDTDIQDYFEIQIFKYRAARSLPSIKENNQGSNQPGAQIGGAYYDNSNRRGNRQNFRLQDLQSTIQLPMPPSIKDMNSVDFAGGTMSGLAASLFGPTVTAFLGGKGKEQLDNEKVTGLRDRAAAILKSIGNTTKDTVGNLLDAVQDKGFRRVTGINAIAQAVAGIGVSIDVDQAITRVSGAIRNPNLELLFKGPALRSFSFNIRLTPRDPDESKRVRMIIRALKQHSAAKRNPQIFLEGGGQSDLGSNFLLGTPDVFKLRYIKARTQRDIKGLNKFKTCALNSIAIDYTGEIGRFAVYEEDSQPVTTIISLNFTELTPIYDEDYAEFTNDDDVGM
tara:strand:- start:26 stop:1315 length:1290 start_codon:yes stop_codon:yes gene_type:complete